MFNRKEYGIHHPGNIVPTCKSCNTRLRNPGSTYINWIEQLELVCRNRGQENMIVERKGRILVHMKEEDYLELTIEERNAIRVIAETLYQDTKSEFDKSVKLFQQLHKAFVTK
ncbi:hypothetical protein ACFLTP_02765 [Chloroflexota bacterium]